MIITYDKNSNPVIWDGNSKYHDLFGNDVTTTQTAYYEQHATISGVAIDATGVKAENVTFPVAFSTDVKEVFVSYADPTATDAELGQATYSATVSGVVVNVPVITASVTSGATVSLAIKALGY